MSTKTTFKRVALVAVASLGFGVLTSVAPASAVATGAVTSITPGASSAARVGIATSNTVTLNGTFANTDTVTVSVRVISAPAASAFATAAGVGASFVTGVQATGNPNAAKITMAAGTATGAAVATTPAFSLTGAAAAATITDYVTGVFTTTATGTTLPVKITTTPDVAGTYTVLVSTASTSRTQVAGSFVAGDTSTTYTFTTAGSPATVAISAIGGTGNSGGTGRLVLVTVKDAAGNATVPTDTESINLSSSKTTTGFSASTGSNPSTSPTANTLGLSAANFVAGTGSSALVRVTDSASTTATVITAAGGGTLSPSVSVQSSLTFTASTLTGASTAKLGQITATVAYPEGGYAVLPTVSSNAATANVVSTSTSRSWRVVYTNASTTTAAVAEITVTDTSGLITGVANATYAQSVSIAAEGTGANFVVTTLAPISTGSYAVALTTTSSTATDLLTLTVTGALSAPTGAAAKIAPVGVTAFTAAPASTVTQTVKLTDQFGTAIANGAITVGITGRNAAKTGSVIITDASGLASYALLDAGTLGTTDTVTFTAGSAVSTTATTTITWGTVTVATVTLNGGNTTAGVADALPTVRDINAGDGVESTTYGITATLKDANGVLLGGVPVTFSVAGSGVAITSTTIKGVTTSAGVVTAQVYGWTAGTYTVTAVAGAITATGTITFGQTAKGEERTISATVSGPIVTAKAVDRLGNVVPGVTIYATKTGTGYFGAGTTSAFAVTNAAGIAEFVIAGGSADVTVSTINPADPANSYGSGQTSAPKGYLSNARTAAALALLAFTATTAGTATKNEAGVGASFDAAGVASATVSVDMPNAAEAAADAAAEATDAANAATDAANAAAEAADAATAAAQDAADAVAALSTQVSEMIDALKKQITALTNLVIKIQKKVKA